MEDQRLILRLNSCQEVLHTISNMMNDSSRNERVIQQLQQLNNLMANVDSGLITESYMQRIESAANQLFNELAWLFKQQQLGELYGSSEY
jgi:DNA-binding FrmR family transcriptional regulator